MIAINETIIRDIIDLATDFSNLDELEQFVVKRNRTSIKSITSKAKDLTLTFPVLCSKSLNIESASIVARAIEKQCAAMLQMLFAAMCVSADNGFDFVSAFHTNLYSQRGLDEFINTMDRLVEEQVVIPTDEIFYTIKENLRTIARLDSDIESDINESSLSRFSVARRFGDNIILENPTSEDKESVSKYTDAEIKYFKGQLLPSDVKKANELLPTMLAVRYVNSSISSDDDDAVYATFVVGVKAKIYPIDSKDILDRIRLKYTDKNLLLNLIKATSKEISFFKDFVFMLDRAKLDAKAQSRVGGSSKLWRILERRALRSKFRRGLFMVNDATAISTIVISQEDADLLYKTSGINIEAPDVIMNVLDGYNLMGFVICDEIAEIAKIIFDDGEKIFETITYSQLEKEVKEGNRETKKILNLVNRSSY